MGSAAQKFDRYREPDAWSASAGQAVAKARDDRCPPRRDQWQNAHAHSRKSTLPAISRQSLKYLKSLLPVAQSASPIFRATAIDTSLMAGLDFDCSSERYLFTQGGNGRKVIRKARSRGSLTKRESTTGSIISLEGGISMKTCRARRGFAALIAAAIAIGS